MIKAELQYRAEYSKSSRATCKSCNRLIEAGSLRLCAMSPNCQDRKFPFWYHFQCFFGKRHPTTTAEIDNFKALRKNDQHKIEQEIAGLAAAGAVSNFRVMIDKTGRAGCRGCGENILKGEVRISILDQTSHIADLYGWQPHWHHVQCFVQRRELLEWYGAAQDLPGFDELPSDVQERLKDVIKPIKNREGQFVAAPAIFKPRPEDQELLDRQNEAVFQRYDQLNRLRKQELADVIEHNLPGCQWASVGKKELLERVADYMTFGMPEACTKCKTGLLVYSPGRGYTCSFRPSRCPAVLRVPPRTLFSVPAVITARYTFLGQYEQLEVSERFILDSNPTAASGTKTTSGTKTAASGTKNAVSGAKMATSVTKTTASGTKTTASGTKTTASGTKTTASGTKTTASGTKTTASGTKTTASGTKTTASGTKTTASGTKPAASGSKTASRSTSARTAVPPNARCPEERDPRRVTGEEQQGGAVATTTAIVSLEHLSLNHDTVRADEGGAH